MLSLRPYALAAGASGGAAVVAAFLLSVRQSNALLFGILGAVAVTASWSVGLAGSRRANPAAAAATFFLRATSAGALCSLVFGFVFMVVIIYVAPNYTGDIWVLGGTTLLFALGTAVTVVAAAGAPLAWLVARSMGQRETEHWLLVGRRRHAEEGEAPMAVPTAAPPSFWACGSRRRKHRPPSPR